MSDTFTPETAARLAAFARSGFSYGGFRDDVDTALAYIATQAKLVETLRREAEMHAQEARTQRATVHEIYQLVTSATGESGDWNGAEPVRQVLAEQAKRIEELEHDLMEQIKKAAHYGVSLAGAELENARLERQLAEAKAVESEHAEVGRLIAEIRGPGILLTSARAVDGGVEWCIQSARLSEDGLAVIGSTDLDALRQLHAQLIERGLLPAQRSEEREA